jgi:hypothetical protein
LSASRGEGVLSLFVGECHSGSFWLPKKVLLWSCVEHAQKIFAAVFMSFLKAALVGLSIPDPRLGQTSGSPF